MISALDHQSHCDQSSRNTYPLYVKGKFIVFYCINQALRFDHEKKIEVGSCNQHENSKYPVYIVAVKMGDAVAVVPESSCGHCGERVGDGVKEV